MTHKHCDDLAVSWSEGTENILVDAGMQYGYEGVLYSGPLWEKGFSSSVPNRVYSESVHAHNCVEINGETYSRKIPPYGALPLSGRQLSETCWLLKGEWQRPEGFRHVRHLVFSPARWLLILDELTPMDNSKKEDSFSQWFHFDHNIDVAEHQIGLTIMKLSDGTLLHCQNFQTYMQSLHKGEFVPHLQGWQVVDANHILEPSWALGIHYKGCSAKFETLFSLAGPCIMHRKYNNIFYLQFTQNGQIEKFAI